MSLPMDLPSCNACGPGTAPGERHTCWRRETDNKSDEQPPPAKRQRTNDTQPKGPGSVKDGWHQFEMKMAALIGLRGLHRGDDFELFSNRDGAGNFDDLVYTAGGRRYFLQLKHANNPGRNKLTVGYVVPLLQRCFKSYCAIKKGDTFKDIPIDKSEFIVYTNKELNPALLKHKRRHREIDIFFKTFEKGEIFSFTPDDKNKDTDVYTLLENSLTRTKELRDLCDRETVTEFLNKLIMVTGQKSQHELDEVIIEEIRKDDAVSAGNEVYKTELLEFKTRVEVWCRGTKGKMTETTLRNWLQEAKTASCNSVVRSMFKSCAKKLARTGIKFSDSEISRLQAELSNKRAVHLRSDALPLCSILLLDCLDTSKCIFVNFESLQSNENMLFHAWLGGHWEWLIVSCDSTVQQSDISDTCLKISEIIKRDPSNKRVIILTEQSGQLVRGFVPIEHEFSIEQLSKDPQEMVLDKKIDFQGCEVTMRSVLQRHGNVEHVLGPELVTDLVTGETDVNIGRKLHVNTDHYVPRVFKRKIWLPSNILGKRDTYPDVFAVSGIEEPELVELVPSDEEVGNFYFDEDSATGNASHSSMFQKSRFIVLRGRNLKSSFLKLQENRCKKTLHWLKYKHGKLLWKETRGEVGNMMRCIDAEETDIDKRILREFMTHASCEVIEESIWDLGERTVLLVAEPGMGKTSTTTQVARHTKESDPASWVVRINWNDHTRKLEAINAATFKLDTLVDFLRSAAFPDSKYTDINSSLLKQALQSSGNVTVLMDGFDEICPQYADKAAVILSELMKTKVARIWVTSRPVVREKLERELRVTAFTLKKLSYESQEEMLRHIWAPKAIGNRNDNCLNEYIKLLLSRASESVYLRNFTGCPLHISVLASAFEENLDKSLRSERIGLPEKLDLFPLYETFLSRKLDIYETEKKKENFTNASVQDDSERLKETYLEDLKKFSLLAILPPPLNLLHKTTELTLQPYINRFQAGKDKLGIVMNVLEGKPQFVHPTLAEYFTARWLSENFESNRTVLEDILFSPSYGTVRNFFDRILAKDCPLHSAVLDRDTKVVQILLQKGSDVNARDKGGRTAMHLIAAEAHDDHICKKITDSLLRHRACVDTKDSMLQWTAFDYAMKAENWFVADRLLEKGFKPTGFKLIRQRVDDKTSSSKIVGDIRGKNYNLRFRNLRSVCANTKSPRLIKAAVAKK